MSSRQTPSRREVAILEIASSAFGNGQRIPVEHTKDGADRSPALSWSEVPVGTRSLALICDDPDAPREEPWVHWVLYRLPATLRSLPEGISGADRPEEIEGAIQGRNDFGDPGYGGPQPPRGHGIHRYRFRLYALSETPDLSPGATKKDLIEAMKGRILGTGELVGTYSR